MVSSALLRLFLPREFVQNVSEKRQLPVGLEAVEIFPGFQPAGDGPLQRHLVTVPQR